MELDHHNLLGFIRQLGDFIHCGFEAAKTTKDNAEECTHGISKPKMSVMFPLRLDNPSRYLDAADLYSLCMSGPMTE